LYERKIYREVKLLEEKYIDVSILKEDYEEQQSIGNNGY